MPGFDGIGPRGMGPMTGGGGGVAAHGGWAGVMVLEEGYLMPGLVTGQLTKRLIPMEKCLIRGRCLTAQYLPGQLQEWIPMPRR